jgi:arylsulfatase
MVFPGKKAADVGIDLATPVVESKGSEARLRFGGHVEQVTIEVHDANRAADAAVRKGMAEVEKHTG